MISIQNYSKHLELHIKEDILNLQVLISDFIYTVLAKRVTLLYQHPESKEIKFQKIKIWIGHLKKDVYLITILSSINKYPFKKSETHDLNYK